MPATGKPTITTILVWAAALLIGVFLCTQGWSLVFWNGGVHPVSNDSFYHMTRILAIAGDPSSIHEFDPLLHWPDGLWIVWPWGFDYLVGFTVGLLSAGGARPDAIAMFTPLVFLIINITLAGLIARKLLSPRLAAVCLLAYAASPTIMSLHQLGKIDHHYAEHSLALLAMYLVMRWQEQPDSGRRAALLGVTLGAASAFHNGLFILQIPLLAVLLFNRLLHDECPPLRSVACFAAALLLAQLLVLLPSRHFHDLTYEFYYLSWFHLHVAFLTCVAVFAISRPGKGAMWATLAAGAILALPAARQAIHGFGFIGAQLPELEGIKEANSPFWGNLAWRRVTNFYSGIIWIAPLAAIWAVVTLFRDRRSPAERAALIFGVFSIGLLAAQVRFNQYGSLYLVLLPLLVIQSTFKAPRDVVYAAVLFIGAYAQSITAYAIRVPLGGSDRYDQGYALIQALETACESAPGLLLADRNWGNFLRYRTNCPLIANNFIMTEDDFRVLARNAQLLSLSPDQLLVELPELNYVLASSSEINELSRQLLAGPHPRFQVLSELSDSRGGVFARAYMVLPPGPETSDR